MNILKSIRKQMILDGIDYYLVDTFDPHGSEYICDYYKLRQFFAEHPEKFDPREYLGPGREAIKAMVKHKLVDVLGCNGKA